MIEAITRAIIRRLERRRGNGERALLETRIAELEAELARRRSAPRALPRPRARVGIRAMTDKELEDATGLRIPDHLRRRAEEARRRAGGQG